MLGNQQRPWQGTPYFPVPPFVPGVQVTRGFCSFCQLGQRPHCLTFPRVMGRLILGTSWALVMCFPHGGRSLPPSMHLHPWDAVDVLLGLPCPYSCLVSLSVAELFFGSCWPLEWCCDFLVCCLFYLFLPGLHVFLLTVLSYVVFPVVFTGTYCLFLVCQLLCALWHLSSSVRLLTPNLFRAAYSFFSLSLSCLETAFHHLPCIRECVISPPPPPFSAKASPKNCRLGHKKELSAGEGMQWECCLWELNLAIGWMQLIAMSILGEIILWGRQPW